MGHDQQFGVDIRPVETERFGTDLVKLAQAALLRPLVAKHRPSVPQPRCLIEQPRLLAGPHAAGRALGAKRETFAVAILEGIHLLFDDIGNLADGAFEQFRLLENGETDFPQAVALEKPAHRILEILPQRGLIGQEVIHAPDRLDFLHCYCVFSREVAMISVSSPRCLA